MSYKQVVSTAFIQDNYFVEGHSILAVAADYGIYGQMPNWNGVDPAFDETSHKKLSMSRILERLSAQTE